jgi:outer membrane protein assembly factor BamB
MSYDLKTGEPHWEPQRLEGLGNIYASPVGADGRVYVMDRDGNSMVIRNQQKFEVLAQNKLEDTFDASPAIAGDELFLRGHKYMYCVAER